MNPARFCVVLALACFSAAAFAETVKDREGAVRSDKAAMEKDRRWIYNDWQQGFDEAKKTGKPLLVVLRCVPCLACAGIDAEVLLDNSLAPLLDRFVCVRVINANALDLSLFQFDYDLSFSAIFFNADGAVYGRYGSWTHQKNPLEKETASLRSALEGALALHAGYPGNRGVLAGKKGDPMPIQDPLKLPALAGRFPRELDWEGKVVKSCVHCHQIGDAFREHYRAQRGVLDSKWIYPWPAPETVGITLAADRPTHIAAVAAASPAAASGLKTGDTVVSIAGQPPVSVADLSWVLHRAPDEGVLPVVVKRGGKELSLKIELPAGWRAQADISRRVGTWPMRAMATGGLVLESLSEEDRKRLALPDVQMALKVKNLGEFGKHAAARKAGFQKGDILIEVDGSSTVRTESQLLGDLLQRHRPGEKVKAAVLRGEQRLELTLPIQ